MVIFLEIELNEINKYNFIIIDIRDNYEYQKRHLENSINIPFMKLLTQPEKYLNKEKKYLLVCEYGIKSKKVCEILNKQDYNTYSLINGIFDKTIDIYKYN